MVDAVTDSTQNSPASRGSSAQGGAGRGTGGAWREPDFDLTLKGILEDAPPRPQPVAGGRAAPRADRKVRRRGGKGALVVAWLSLIAVVAVSSLAYVEITALRSQLAVAQRSIDAMSLLTEGQYEDLRVALDAAADQRGKWGKTVDERLTFLDGEMRKLWVVAHQTNQPRIEKLEEGVKSLTSSTTQQGKLVSAAQKKLAEWGKRETELKKQGEIVERLRTTVAEQDIRLNDVPITLEALRSQINEVQASSKEAEALLEQLNQSRAQINRSIDQLTQEIRGLKGAEGGGAGL